MGSRDRTEVEDRISSINAVDPVELSEIRFVNSLLLDKFNKIMCSSGSTFANGSSSYFDFINFVSKNYNLDIKLGYLLDRIVMKYFENDSSKYGNLVVPDTEGRIPLGYLLVVLSTTVQSKADERVSQLFELGTKYIYRTGEF